MVICLLTALFTQTIMGSWVASQQCFPFRESSFLTCINTRLPELVVHKPRTPPIVSLLVAWFHVHYVLLGCLCLFTRVGAGECACVQTLLRAAHAAMALIVTFSGLGAGKYDDQILQLFVSSLYLAAAFFAQAANITTRKYGRKVGLPPAMHFACSCLLCCKQVAYKINVQL